MSHMSIHASRNHHMILFYVLGMRIKCSFKEEIQAACKYRRCGSIGAGYTHNHKPSSCPWLQYDYRWCSPHKYKQRISSTHSAVPCSPNKQYHNLMLQPLKKCHKNGQTYIDRLLLITMTSTTFSASQTAVKPPWAHGHWLTSAKVPPTSTLHRFQ